MVASFYEIFEVFLYINLAIYSPFNMPEVVINFNTLNFHHDYETSYLLPKLKLSM